MPVVDLLDVSDADLGETGRHERGLPDRARLDGRGTGAGRGEVAGADPAGAIMAAVTIRAVQTETRLVSSTKTNNDGLYQIRYLLPGRYDLTAESPGFKTTARSGIEIRVNDRVELNLTLEVGAVGEKVEVPGETPILETTSASMGQVVDHRRI